MSIPVGISRQLLRAVIALVFVTVCDSATAEEPSPEPTYSAFADGELPTADGFRGIWYANQPSHDEYVYKYSGGMATYPHQQLPMAIYAPAANKTFFVYGGRYHNRNTLLHMISYYDHATGKSCSAAGAAG